MIPIDTQDIYQLIKQGEGPQIDFKHSISNPKKIAIAIVAFANHIGGVLLVGIKDNGRSVKINCAEEAYMLESALTKCKPEIDYLLSEHLIDGKKILCMQVAMGREKPYFCLDEHNKWLAHVRNNDSNVMVNWVWIQVVKQKMSKHNLKLEYHGVDEAVIKHLKANPNATQRSISKKLNVNYRKVGNVLVSLIGMGIVNLDLSKNGAFYSMNV